MSHERTHVSRTDTRALAGPPIYIYAQRQALACLPDMHPFTHHYMNTPFSACNSDDNPNMTRGDGRHHRSAALPLLELTHV